MRRAAALLLALVACRSQATTHDAGPDVAATADGRGPRGQVIFDDNVLSGCIDVNGKQVCGDGGIVNGVVDSNGNFVSSIRIPKRLHRPEGAKQKAVFAPPDPRVVACTKTAENKTQLMACLDGLKIAPVTEDAGPRKFGAVRPPPVNPAWVVPAWFFGPSGSDSNTCVDSSHPCQHFYEIVARWGTNRPVIQSNVVITLLGDQPDNTDCIDLRPIMVNDAGLLNFVGQLTQVSTGTMSGVVANNRGSSPFWQANLGAAASGAIGLLLLDSTQSAVMWVGNVSGSVATFTQPFGASVTTPPAWWNGGGVGTPAELTIANGDAFTTQRLPKACVIAFAPTTQASWPAAGGDGILAMMGRIWVMDTSGTNSHSMLTNPTARITESRIDTELLYETLVNNAVGEVVFNSYLAGTGTISFSVFGGLLGTPANPLETFCRGCSLDGDIQVYGPLTIFPAVGGISAISNIGRAYLSGTEQVVAPVEIVPLQYGGPSLYGTYTLNLNVGGTIYYQGSAVSAFGGTPTLQFAGTSFGDAVDETLDLSPRRPHRALTPANLDATIASGGFGSIAYGPGESVIASTSALGGSPTPSAYLNASAPVSISPNTPATGQVSVGFTPSTCPAGQYVGGNPLACSTPSGTGISCPVNLATCVTGTLGTGNGGFACSSLNPCTGGQLPTSGIQPGAHNTLLATDNGGTVAWKGITPGGDINLSAPITGSSIPFMVIGWNTIPLSGAAPAVGNVYVYSGSNWAPGSPIGGAAFDTTTGSHVIPATGAITSLGSLSVTVPSGGGNISVFIVFLISNPDNFTIGAGHLADDITVGVGFNSSTSFDNATQQSVIVRDSSGAANTGKATVVAPDYFASQAAGGYTIYALASSSTETFTVLAQIWALVTK